MMMIMMMIMMITVTRLHDSTGSLYSVSATPDGLRDDAIDREQADDEHTFIGLSGGSRG